MKSIAQRQAEGIKPISVKSGEADHHLFDRLTVEAKDKVCDECLSDIWPAWQEGTWQLRCRTGFAPMVIKKRNQISVRRGQAMQLHNPDLPAVIDSAGQAITRNPDPQPLSIATYRERRALMAEVVGDMEDGVDYGIIPGTKDKSLWEPGAEALRFTFNIQFRNECLLEEEDFKTHLYRYRYKCVQLLGPGIDGPSWEAFGTSRERKFWCKGGKYADSCPNPCDTEHPPKGMEPAMLPHNVRDRVQKRAFVAMIRNVTGATGLFKGAGTDRYDTSDDMPYGNDDEVTGGGNDHPWLVTCPVHKIKWFKSGNMREAAHKDQAGEWCNQSRVLKPMIDEQLKEIVADSWEKKDVDAFLKANFGGTWSTLSPKLQLDAIEQLKTTPPPGSEPTASDGNPVDTETGEIQGPPPESEGVPPENQGAMAGMGESDHQEH